ncbi:putative lipid II flippase FtsW [Candidatus Gottesmanbacteria bacterium]|nr:putative lipid II flippase FtsW [Candidatus Gottesmanbacteria bacterium]
MRKRHHNITLYKQKKGADWSIAILCAVLGIFGLLMIYESSNVSAFRDFGDKYHFVKDQLTWGILGTLGFIFASLFDYHKYYKLALPALLGTVLLLILVFVPGVGIHALGANRWIGLGLFSIQPAEIAKLSLVIYLSAWLSYKEKGRFLPFILLVGLFAGLVILEPDLGTSIIIVSVSLILYFTSGAPLLHFLLLLPGGVIGTVLLAITSPYRLKRLTTFLNPSIDPLGASYHIRQVLIALGSGGWFGLGLGASRQKYEFLPEATTDSIFAIIGEEFGFIGAVILISLFVLLLYRIFKIAKSAPDKFGFLLAAGILGIIGMQIIVNLGAMTALLPLTGVPLPFISYGGSNLIITLVSCGILLNISRQQVTRKRA